MSEDLHSKLIQDARRDMNMGNLISAIEKVNELLERQPYNHIGILLRAELASLNGNLNEALELLDKALSRGTSHKVYWEYKFETLRRFGLHNQVLEYFQDLNPLHLTSVGIIRTYSACLYALGREEEAFDVLQSLDCSKGVEVNLEEKSQNYQLPKKIFQYWDQGIPTPDMSQIMNSWKSVNKDFDYELFDYYKARSVIQEFGGERLLEMFESAEAPAMRSDIFRYCILFLSGGTYVDAEHESILPISWLWTGNAKISVTVKFNGMFANNVILAMPSNKIFFDAVNISLSKFKPESKEIYSVTGPPILTAAINKSNEPRTEWSEQYSLRIIQRVANHLSYRKENHWTKFKESDSKKSKKVVPSKVRQNKVIFHIGPYKTGSSAIQELLHKSRLDLLSLGVNYYSQQENEINNHNIFWQLRNSNFDWDFFKKEISKKELTILSSEHFSILTGQEITQLSKNLDNYQVCVFIVNRLPNQVVLSQWRDHMKIGYGYNLREAIEKHFKSPYATAHKLADLWNRNGNFKIQIFPYEQDNTHLIDAIVTDITDLQALNITNDFFLRRSQNIVNHSYGALTSIALWMCNRLRNKSLDSSDYLLPPLMIREYIKREMIPVLNQIKDDSSLKFSQEEVAFLTESINRVYLHFPSSGDDESKSLDSLNSNRGVILPVIEEISFEHLQSAINDISQLDVVPEKVTDIDWWMRCIELR